MSVCDIIIPTWNNPTYLTPCIASLLSYTIPDDLFKIYIVNNGEPEQVEMYKGNPYIEILQQKENMGWEGGLKAGLEASNSPYVLFLNDDTFIPSSNRLWLTTLLNHFAYPDCAAVGPISNVVMGKQNMFHTFFESSLRTKFLIGFCMLVRRSDLIAAGGIDCSMPGGDDLDLSIRLRKLGKYLLIDRNVFVYHHGFKTGERIEGSNWNSVNMIERTNHALIRKHGLRSFLDLWEDESSPSTGVPQNWGDPETDIVKRFSIGDKIAELGCGDKKTLTNAVGIDIVPKGQEIPGLNKGRLSLADVTANVEHELPIQNFDTIIARHVLEHMVDAVGAVQSWRKSLKHGGRLIIAVPDHTTRNTIPMNWEHRHAWTPKSLKRFMESLGWKTVDLLDARNNVSFVGIFEANGLH